jgi:hypothetical protein
MEGCMVYAVYAMNCAERSFSALKERPEDVCYVIKRVRDTLYLTVKGSCLTAYSKELNTLRYAHYGHYPFIIKAEI